MLEEARYRKIFLRQGAYGIKNRQFFSQPAQSLDKMEYFLSSIR